MHEWALAEAVIKTTLGKIREENIKRILEIRITVGELQQIDLDIFKFSLKELSKGTPLENANFKISIERAVFKCLNCGFKWEFSPSHLKEHEAEAIHFIPELAHSFVKCPNCNSVDFEVIKGRGVWIEGIILERK